jgi:hypothetical protein
MTETAIIVEKGAPGGKVRKDGSSIEARSRQHAFRRIGTPGCIILLKSRQSMPRNFVLGNRRTRPT